LPYAPASGSARVEVYATPAPPWELLVTLGLGVAGLVAVLSLIAYNTVKKGA
jgi:hypothetical protein